MATELGRKQLATERGPWQRGASPAAKPSSIEDKQKKHSAGRNGHAPTRPLFPTAARRTHDGLVPVGPGKAGRSAVRTQLLIVDEHPLVRAGVRRLVDSEPGVDVAEATSVDHAIEVSRRSVPDVVVMDIDVADNETIDEMRRLRDGLRGNAALVVLARHHDDEGVYGAVVGGAAGIVGENAAPAELVETIREAALGNEPISQTLAERPAVARRVLETYSRLLAARTVTTHEPRLTQRELSILSLAAQGMTNQQIGRSIGVSEHTIKSAVSHVLARLGLRHRTEAVVHAVRNGWINPSAGHEKAAAGVTGGRSLRGDFA